ncbi:MAG: LptF/LptG family permease [Elusimicrobiaceae bacterium]|nr:LptF/LptG family permease [Elusimicrobiaceae bacterium]
MHVRIFTRYIAKSLITLFVGVLGILTFVIFMNHFIRVMNMAMTYGTSWGWVFSSLLNLVPDVFCLSAPMAFQIAILLTLTGMSEQGELIALRAAGFSFKEIVRPLAGCAIVLAVILVIMSNWVTPHSYQKVLNLRTEARSKITKVNLEPKTFLDLGEWELYVEDLDPKTGEAKQIQLLRKNDAGAQSTTVNASRGKVLLSDSAIGLQLHDGQMRRLDGKDASSFIAANFDDYTMHISLFRNQQRRLRVGEMTTTKLLRRLKKTPLDKATRNEYRTEISMRNVMALSPLILLFVSCPLGFSLGKRTNKGWGMLFSVVIIFLFYLLMTLGISLGKKYGVLAYPAPWLPVFVGIGAGYYLWKKRLNI